MERFGLVAETVATTEDDLVEILLGQRRLTVSSGGFHTRFRRPPPLDATALRVQLAGMVRHDWQDQVVVLKANTSIAELQEELAKHGQCIPYLPFYGTEGTVAGHLSMNLPHAYASFAGSWKEWLLGARVVLANGLAAKCGSQVVKSVAGYDIHKFLIGARGTLAILTELTLRTTPLKALPSPDLILGPHQMGDKGLIQRVLPSDFESFLKEAGEDLIASHPGSSVLYRAFSKDQSLPSVGQGWQVGWGLGELNCALADHTARHYFASAKERFDPDRKLNPGEFGEALS